MHEVVARLHIKAIATTLLTRLNRSASNATGRPVTATTTEITDTRPPSCLSLRPHSTLR
jgi:hypothetical protein